MKKNSIFNIIQQTTNLYNRILVKYVIWVLERPTIISPCKLNKVDILELNKQLIKSLLYNEGFIFKYT